MDIGSLYASLGIDLTSLNKDLSKAESIFAQAGTSISKVSGHISKTLIEQQNELKKLQVLYAQADGVAAQERLQKMMTETKKNIQSLKGELTKLQSISLDDAGQEGILDLFRKKMPDAFNALQNRFLQLQDEGASFIDYFRTNMPGAFETVASEFMENNQAMVAGLQQVTAETAEAAEQNTVLETAVQNLAFAEKQRQATMAEEIATLAELKIRQQAAYDPDEILQYDKAIKEVQNRIKLLGSGMSKFKDISTMSLGEMKLELRRLRNTPLELASPEHMAAVKQRMAELTESVGNYGKELRAQGDTTQRFITTVQGIVGVVQAVSGTLALFGVENENVEKSMLALMNVSQALSTFHDLNEKGILKNIAARIKNVVAINAETAAMKAQAAATSLSKPTSIKGVDVGKLSLAPIGQQASTAATGVKVLAGAMSAVPWAAAIMAVGAIGLGLANYFNNLRKVSEAEKEWKNVIKDNKALKENVSIYEETIKALKELTLEYQVMTGTISKLQAEEIRNTASAEETKAKIRGNFVSFQLDEQDKLNKLIKAKNDAFYQSSMRGIEQSYEAQQLAEQRHNAEIENLKKQSALRVETERKNSWAQMDKVDEAARQKTKIAEQEEAKRRQEEARQAWQTYLNEYKTWTQKIQDMQDDMIVSDEAREITKLQRRRDREIEDLNLSKLNAEQKGQMILTITEYYLQQEQTIHDKYTKQRADTAEQARQTEMAKVSAYYDDLNAKMDAAEQRRNDLVNTYLTLRSQNKTLSHQERIKALEKLEEIRYKAEQEKYKGQTAILEELAIQHTQNMAAINKTTFEGETAAIDWAERWKEAGTQAAQAMESAAVSMVTSMAEMIGAGGATAQDFGKMVLGTLADLAITVGKIAIATGISIAGIKKALESLNPVAAVVAGAALVALGTWAKGALAGAAEEAAGSTNAYTNLGGAGLMQGLATGGTVMKAGSFLVGERGPEVVNLPGRASVTPNHMLGDLLLTTNISGSDLQIILQRAAAKSKRG